MQIKYEKPTKAIYLLNGEFDGYETEEVIFNVDYDDLIKCYFNYYYGDEYDYKTFKDVLYYFDIDLEKEFKQDNDLIEKLYFDYFLSKK